MRDIKIFIETLLTVTIKYFITSIYILDNTDYENVIVEASKQKTDKLQFQPQFRITHFNARIIITVPLLKFNSSQKENSQSVVSLLKCRLAQHPATLIYILQNIQVFYFIAVTSLHAMTVQQRDKLNGID